MGVARLCISHVGLMGIAFDIRVVSIAWGFGSVEVCEVLGSDGQIAISMAVLYPVERRCYAFAHNFHGSVRWTKRNEQKEVTDSGNLSRAASERFVICGFG